MRNMTFALASLILWNTGNAAIIPILDISDLATSADLIAIGPITSVEEVGATSIETLNGSVPARAMRATMTLDQLVKGRETASTIEILFALPDRQIGYANVSSGSYSIVFVRKRDTGVYGFVSPYYPTLRAVPGTSGAGDNPYERVLSILIAGLQASTLPEARSLIIMQLARIDNPIVIDALTSVLSDTDPTVRLMATASLLSSGQVSALPLAEVALGSDTNVDSGLLHNLRIGISEGMRSEDAIPGLERLLQNADPETRRAAANALSKTESLLIVKPLMSALDNSDSDVRLAAVQGLAKILDQRKLLPTIDGFRADEQRYIAPLRSLGARALGTR